MVISLDSVWCTDFQFAFTTSGLSKDLGAAKKRELQKKLDKKRVPFADDDILGMAVDSGDRVASGALNIHEIGVGGLDKSLELVLSLFFFEGRVQKINIHLDEGENQGQESKVYSDRWALKFEVEFADKELIINSWVFKGLCPNNKTNRIIKWSKDFKQNLQNLEDLKRDFSPHQDIFVS